MSSPKSKDLRTLDILKNIKAGKIKPEALSPDQRRPVVTLLMAEGQSTAEIALLLQTSDRTIERDKKAIRENNAISEDPAFTGIMAGRLVDEAQICVQRIRKFQRESNCPPAAKIEGERACFQIPKDFKVWVSCLPRLLNWRQNSVVVSTRSPVLMILRQR
ncbi:MAG: helix-turn-helix transcriptional regulator [Planctomycetota bacterium]|jgi:transposase